MSSNEIYEVETLLGRRKIKAKVKVLLKCYRCCPPNHEYLKDKNKLIVNLFLNLTGWIFSEMEGLGQHLQLVGRLERYFRWPAQRLRGECSA